MAAKACTSCGQIKPLADFNPRQGKCKQCERAYLRRWREEHRDHVNAGNRQRYRDRAATREQAARERREARERELARRTAKTCSSCGQAKPLADFGPRPGRAGGLQSECRECATARVARWRAANPGRSARAARRFRARHREQIAASSGSRLFALQKQTLPRATNHGKQWTGPELELLLRDDLTIKQMALMLGRTYAATAIQRHLARTDPRKIALAGLGRAA